MFFYTHELQIQSEQHMKHKPFQYNHVNIIYIYFYTNYEARQIGF